MSRPISNPIFLTEEERKQLERRIRCGKVLATVNTRCRALLLMDRSEHGPARSDGQIEEALGCSPRTLNRLRTRFATERLGVIEHRHPRRHRPHKIDGDIEAHLIQLACSEPPEGHARWSLRLLADRLVSLGVEVSHETVRRTLKKTKSNRG